MRGGVQEKWRIKERERTEEDSWEDWGREDERWLDGLSFDPSLSDAPFNVLTETTWGTPREAVCLFISARGGGVSLIYRRLSASQPSTLGWLKDTDGPLPHSVNVFGELSKPAAWSQWSKPAFITRIQERPNKEIFCVTNPILLLLPMKWILEQRSQSKALFNECFSFFFCASLFFTLCLEKKMPWVSLIIYLSSLHHNQPPSFI